MIVRKQDWDFKDLIKYYNQRYNYVLKPVSRRSVSNIDKDCSCPCCGAPLAAQQFFLKLDEIFNFDVTQVIGLTNEDPVSTEFRPFKWIVERLNRTFKATYRVRCGYDILDDAPNMPAKWQMLIFLGQQYVLNGGKGKSNHII